MVPPRILNTTETQNTQTLSREQDQISARLFVGKDTDCSRQIGNLGVCHVFLSKITLAKASLASMHDSFDQIAAPADAMQTAARRPATVGKAIGSLHKFQGQDKLIC